ncbi:HTH-type transcriptional activator RhaR [Emticicia aquatica]|jgi:YesN/AraC family two-component response regulator|uniref:HTH-type transcriptional activator RhaR n=1 Tax=Emticicia aquatica TaxID=1681835 RepID=A0ABM9AKT4_9BACT|nr:helix-turn-helix domain-containing protein [Emticicia aquatica]CAH0994372.1 HTH-type transcriptional activator RhaR [Emticicia aquatica]
MSQAEKIPTLQPSEMTGFHSHSIDWQPVISNTKHQFFHVNRLEDFVHKIKFPLPPHRKTIFDFLYLKKGSTKRSKGLNSYEFGKSTIFFLPAYQITQHEMMSPDIEGFFCHFDEKIFQFLPKNYLNEHFSFFQFQSNPIIQLSPNTQKQIECIFERLLSLYEDQNDIDTNLTAAYLLTLFEEIKKEIPHQTKKTKNAFFQVTEQYKNALAQNIYQKQSITEYAEILHISPNYLNKCVKNSIDKTAQDLLNEMLILEAKTLLKYSNLQVAEIAVKLCNQTPSNFARFFKNQTGTTPKEYLIKY